MKKCQSGELFGVRVVWVIQLSAETARVGYCLLMAAQWLLLMSFAASAARLRLV